jgi:hypothetical protein
VKLVATAANPVRYRLSGLRALDWREGLSSVMADMVFVIDGDGRIRQEIRDSP